MLIYAIFFTEVLSCKLQASRAVPNLERFVQGGAGVLTTGTSRFQSLTVSPL